MKYKLIEGGDFNRGKYEEKWKTSNFLITINTNEKRDTMPDDRYNAFIKSISHVFTEANSINFMKDRNGKIITKEGFDEFSVYPLSPEIGPKTNKLHWHIVLHTTHKYNLAINRGKLSAFYRKAFGKNVYINIKATGNSLQNFISYAEK